MQPAFIGGEHPTLYMVRLIVKRHSFLASTATPGAHVEGWLREIVHCKGARLRDVYGVFSYAEEEWLIGSLVVLFETHGVVRYSETTEAGKWTMVQTWQQVAEAIRAALEATGEVSVAELIELCVLK